MENTPRLFRNQAYDHYLHAGALNERLQVSPPWTWLLLGIVALGTALALALACLGRVEVNTRATAILRPSDGIRSLVAQVAGSVLTVERHTGDQVGPGETILTISAPETEAEALSARREVALLEAEFVPMAQRQDARFLEQRRDAREKVIRIGEQVDSLKRSAAVYKDKWKALEPLADSRVVSKFSLFDAQEMYAQSMRQLSDAEQALAQAKQDVSSLESRSDSDTWDRRKQLDDARARLAALQLSLVQTVVRAPHAGTVDAVILKPGDSVSVGAPLGKVIPDGGRYTITSFLPEKDRAFVKIGDAVRLELTQLPYGQYGSLGARVVRVSGDLASPHEIQNALGNDTKLDTSAYLVDLELTDTAAADKAHVQLRGGMLMQARFTLRKQRPITILLEPLKRWFE